MGVLRDVPIAAGAAQFGVIQAAAASLQIELNPIGVRDADEIERGITTLASGSNGGLIVTACPSTQLHRELIITLAARHQLPAVYFAPSFARDGGLISYGPDLVDKFWQAATKYELAINLKTAKVLGLELPATVLARADEMIE